LQIEPTAGESPASAPSPQHRNIQNEPIERHEMPRPAPECPASTTKTQNEPKPGGLTPRQLTAISALFAGHSFTETARYLRIDRKTLFRWRNSAAFIAEVRRRYAEQSTRRVRAGVEPPWMSEVRVTREGGRSSGW
jgi:hypothetical protein